MFFHLSLEVQNRKENKLQTALSKSSPTMCKLIKEFSICYNIVTRNNIVWKLASARLQSAQSFLTEECSTLFVPPKIKQCFRSKKTNHQYRKTLLSMIVFHQLKNFLYITVNTVHLLYKVAESHIMPGTN